MRERNSIKRANGQGGAKAFSEAGGADKYFTLFEQASDGVFTNDFQGKMLDVNLKLCEMLGYTREELLQLNVKDLFPAPDLTSISLHFDQLRLSRAIISEHQICRKDGTPVQVEISAKIISSDIAQGIVRDITERQRTKQLLDAQKQSLEMVVSGAPLKEVLTYLTSVVEKQAEGRAIASILLLDEEGRLHNGAAPSLPESYISAIDGIRAEPNLGTCSAAAARGVMIITPDIEADPQWQRIKHLPLGLGLRSAWSMPIKARDGRVLGTFGTYFRECRQPTALERQVVEILARTAALAIEGKRNEDALRETHNQLERRVRERTSELARINESLQTEIRERKYAQDARRQLLDQLVTAQEDERSRISRELHDQMGQHITAIMLLIDSLKRIPNFEPASTSILGQLQEVTGQLADEVESLAWELRPTALDDLGLEVALSKYVRKWSERSLVPVDLQSAGLNNARLPPPIETAIYRIVQEALTNIVRYARASTVGIILKRQKNHVSAIVEDNGCGFDVDALQATPPAERRMGLPGMQERAALVGGSLHIESAPGMGTTVYLRIPFVSDEHRGRD